MALIFWQPGFLFTGAPDDRLHAITSGAFPRILVPNKTHPIYAIKALSYDIGFSVCPCSTARPRVERSQTYIRKGCRLQRTGAKTDKNSYLIEHIAFNIPSSLAETLHFMGQVPEECLITEKRRKKGDGR